VGRLPAAARNRPRVLWSSLGHIRVGTVVGPAPAARALMVRISGRSETGPNSKKSRNLCFPRFRAHGSSYPGLRNLAMGWEMHFHFRGFPGPYVVAGAPPHGAPRLCGGRTATSGARTTISLRICRKRDPDFQNFPPPGGSGISTPPGWPNAAMSAVRGTPTCDLRFCPRAGQGGEGAAIPYRIPF